MLGLGIFITAIELTALVISATVKQNAVVVRNYYEIISKATQFSILLGFILLFVSVSLVVDFEFSLHKIKKICLCNIVDVYVHSVMIR